MPNGRDHWPVQRLVPVDGRRLAADLNSLRTTQVAASLASAGTSASGSPCRIPERSTNLLCTPFRSKSRWSRVAVSGTLLVSSTTWAPHLPLRRHARAIQQQFATTEAIRSTFVFNLPTDYLSLAVALHDASQLSRSELEAHVRAQYPVLPQGPTIVWRHALSSTLYISGCLRREKEHVLNVL